MGYDNTAFVDEMEKKINVYADDTGAIPSTTMGMMTGRSCLEFTLHIPGKLFYCNH